jgi:hypothetical protein
VQRSSGGAAKKNPWEQHSSEKYHAAGTMDECTTYNIHLIANEGPVRIQYKCLVPGYVFPERKLLVPKHNYNFLSLSPYTYISVRDLFISRIGLPILLQENMWTDPGNI